MSKKPVVPVKRPTKGRGKGNDKVANVVKAAKTVKAPRMRIIQGRKAGITKLIADVDSIAKGLKELKGLKGGGRPDDYYNRIKGLFSEENMKNIKSLKESLVIDILGTMAGGLDVLVDINSTDAKKVAEIVNFVSIISDIDNLKQGRLDEVINSGNLKGLPYINKISTLVMIKMLIDVYKSIYIIPQIEDEIKFTFLDNTKVLISRIINEYRGDKSKDALKSLTAEVKRELKYYTEIYRLSDYVYIKGKDDDTDVEKIIEELKGICKGVEENDFKKFITSSNINSTDFTTGCDDTNLKTQIGKVNEIIKKMKGQYQTITPIIDELKVNSLYLLLLNDNRDTKGLLSLPDLTEFLYDLYNSITTYENIMEEFKNMKEEYIECVKPFFDSRDLLADYELKEELTPDKKKTLKEGSITDNEITDLEEEIRKIRETRSEIQTFQKKQSETDKLFYRDIPFNMKIIIGLFNKLCSANTTYNQHIARTKNINTQGNTEKKEVIPVTDTDYENSDDYLDYVKSLNYTGGKLTTKYISTGNFVYILYEKKKIKRCIYAKAKGRGKYCKIKGDYMLLSKLKVV